MTKSKPKKEPSCKNKSVSGLKHEMAFGLSNAYQLEMSLLCAGNAYGVYNAYQLEVCLLCDGNAYGVHEAHGRGNANGVPESLTKGIMHMWPISTIIL